MKQSKKLVAACLAAVLLAAGLAGLYLTTRPQVQAGEKSVRVEIVHSDGQTWEEQYRTSFAYLGELLEAEELVVFEDGPYGMYISEADGERAVFEEDGAYWALYEGEEYAVTGADQLVLTDGGAYALVYTNG